MDWKEKASKLLENYITTLEHMQNEKGLGYGIGGQTSNDERVEDTFVAEQPDGTMIHLGITILKEDMEEKTMEKNYTTLREDFGSMPLAGYLNTIINLVKDCDGVDALCFLKDVDDMSTRIFESSEADNFTLREMFFYINKDFNAYDFSEIPKPLSYSVRLTSDNLFDDTEGIKYYRFYTKDQDWGLDEIEPIKEKKYSVVKVQMSRIRKVEEVKTIYIAVSNDFSDEDAETEVESYIRNSYCQNGSDWEENDDFFNEGDWEDSVVVQKTTVVDEDYNMDDYDYELETTLE